MISKYVEVEIYLEEFSDKDLISELEGRGYTVIENSKVRVNDSHDRLFHDLYLDYVEGKNTDQAVKKMLDELYMYVPVRSI